jgi:preprotein translocase subunit SecD
MLNQYPVWKNALVAVVLLFGLLYALPNVFPQDPVIEVTGTRGDTVGETLQQNVLGALERAQIEYKAAELQPDRLQIRFSSAEDQLNAQDVVARALPPQFTHALTLSPDIPGWLTAINGRPMNLGLDLRGGIHVLIDVDMEAALDKAVERIAGNVRTALRNERIRYISVKEVGNGVDIRFKEAALRDQAEEALGGEFRELGVTTSDEGEDYFVRLYMPPEEEREARRLALQQNITTLRNRVNALGCVRARDPATGRAPHRGRTAGCAGPGQGQGPARARRPRSSIAWCTATRRRPSRRSGPVGLRRAVRCITSATAPPSCSSARSS